MNKDFFNRDAEIVARELLGKVLVRNIKGIEMKARIVETEAYFGPEDPASRACQNGDLKKTMEMDSGTILVYGVHNSWLINFVTGEENEARAVLIRALEPLNFDDRCNGPGLLTKALEIGKEFHKQDIIDNEKIMVVEDEGVEGVVVEDGRVEDEEVGGGAVDDEGFEYGRVEDENVERGVVGDENADRKEFEIVESFRIGVKKDLEKPMRFYIKDNKHVSRK